MNELTISLDPRRKIPLYEQIYGFIREEIRGGRIHAGERLPSARALAGYLSVSRSTVDLAYEQLVSEGYLESEPCKGYFVCKIEGLYRLDEKKEETKEAAARGCRRACVRAGAVLRGQCCQSGAERHHTARVCRTFRRGDCRGSCDSETVLECVKNRKIKNGLFRQVYLHPWRSSPFLIFL